MSGLQRKYLSGAAKRKLAEKKKEDGKKLRKISDFLQDNSDKQKEEGLVKPPSIASIDTTKSKVEEVVSLLNEGSLNIHTEERIVDSHVLSESLEPISTTDTDFVNVVTPEEQSSETNFEIADTDLPSQGIILTNNDVAKWPATINTNFIERCLVKGIHYFQNRFETYSSTEKQFGEETRRLTNDIFFRSMKNGERNERFWLVFSPSTQKLFCVACKLFHPDQRTQFVTPGFDDWKNIHARVQNHENNIEHRKTMITLLARLNPTTGINKQIIKQVESETRYWQEVLRRVVAVIKFLCERGLSFRGDEEQIGSARNGNFLGLLELIAQFDPFLKAHIEKYGKKGKGNVSYLSKTICDEFIQLMGQRVSEVITEEIKSAKYFSLIVDSTPDISHIDQLSIVIRYCHDGKVYERLLGFLPITSHTGMSLYESVSEFLRKAGIDLKNCRGQSYDNASNMSGKFEGLQAHIKKACDKAFYIPCAGHSLNLVGVHAVESCQEATNFFGFLQKLYVFFSGSTRRWDIFKKFLNAGDSMQVSVLKSLSSTRWSCHAESCKSLLKNYDAIIGALSEIVNNETEPIDSLREARTLLKHIMKKETSLMSVIWGKILERVNATSTELQKHDIDLSLAVTLLQSLRDTIASMRSEFSDFEEEAAALSGKIDQDFRDASRRKIIKKFSDKTVEPELLSGRKKFEIETFFVIVDKLLTELAKRLSAYEFLNSIFGLITNFEIDRENLRRKLAKISRTYGEDLDDDLLMEWTQFSSFVQSNFLSCGLSASPREIFQFLVSNDLGQVFPNILIIYRLYLTIPVTNCSSERSFSKLSLIKNRLRSSLGEEKLNALLLLSIESDLTRSLTFENIIKDFANEKARKVVLILKDELRILRRRGARNASGEEVSQGRSCARCKAPLGRIYNTGASCPRCRHRVCRQCREYRGSNGTDWLCLVCHKITEIQAVSGEWMNDASGAGTKRIGRRKFLATPADILKRSIRRSWTINGPPASWSAERGSPELRAYQSLPRHQDYFDVSRSDLVIPDETVGGNVKSNDLFASENAAKSNVGGTESSDLKKEEDKRNESVAILDREEEKKGEIGEEESKENNTENVAKAPKGETRALPQNEELINTPRISQIKPPRIHSKFNFTEVKQTPPKSNERKSNIPILRRSSKEFEDIRSPLESAKRSLIPQRYRGSTDDLRRSREDITAPSQIPKLFSPRVKEERLKRQDSKDEIRCGLKLPSSRKEERKDFRDISNPSKSGGGTGTPNASKKDDDNRGDLKSGIKVFRRENSKDCGSESFPKDVISYRISKLVHREDKINDNKSEDQNKKEVESKYGSCGKNDEKNNSENDSNEVLVAVDYGEEMLEKRETPNSKETIKNDRKIEGFKWEKIRNQNENENETEFDKETEESLKDDMDKKNENGEIPADNGEHENEADSKNEILDTAGDNNCQDSVPVEEKEASEVVDSNLQKKITQEDYQVVKRRKFSKEEFSNPDDTDEVPNRRGSSHLSPEASPLSTRSSRYSPRESESEPTPALPRKTGESSSASQRVRDAITRTRRESNSSARYESSGSESIRLSGHVETRRVRFGGGSGIEEVQRDSATSAGEDEPRSSPHNPGSQRDSRTTPGALQGRAVRRRRQFDTQGSRRRGRSHARGSAEDFHHLQVTGRGGCGTGGHLSPTQGGQQGQEQPIIDYRRLVFISSDSSSGREEDDADSSSGSSSLNGAPRSSLAQGLEDCDWDYFESGGSVPPLAHLQVGLIGNPTITANVLNSAQASSATQSTRAHHGISLSSQDWSCCPGRGSSACQACGGARGANVFPVPVPIPVPVPYPVPVPASLWTTGLTNTSMINCTSAELGALQLSRSGGPSSLHPAAAQWFAWPPRFIHDVNAARPNDPQAFLDPRSRDAAAAATFAFHQAREFSQINLHASVVAAELSGTTSASKEKTGEIVKAEIQGPETNAEPDIGDDEGATTEEPEEASSSDSDDELKVKSLPNSVSSNSANSQSKTSTAKMYRLSQVNSGSSSGRSSADSSDLEDSASHHFSRVFVVNDDSSTSDNDPEDVEDIEDSDSNREVGITLRRVTALPEDGPVVLRHVRFLDEDRGPVETRKNLDTSGSDGDNNETKNLKIVGGRDEPIGLQYLRNFDPEANEIYLVDSKDDDSEHRIELKSVRSIDPDVIDQPGESNDKYTLEVESTVETPDPDSLMPETLTGSCTIVPDSLEITENSLMERSSSISSCSIESEDGIPPAGDICAFYSPEINTSDKPCLLVTRGDKRLGLLSEVYDDTVPATTSCSGVSTPCSVMSSGNTKNSVTVESQSLNLTGTSEQSTTGSSETTTGSEVSSDELHEYEITAWSSPNEPEEEYGAEYVDEAAALSAVNEDLIIARSLLMNDKKLIISESETSDFTGLCNEYRDENVPRNNDNVSGFTSDGFSTDEGGSSRLDSGVATGVEDTNASGRTDDGSTASFETTPGESIELVHSPAGLAGDVDANDKRCGDVVGGDNKNQSHVSIDKLRNRVAEDDASYEKLCGNDEEHDSRGKTRSSKDDNDKDHSVNDLISIKIHEIFKSVEYRNVNEERNFFGDILSSTYEDKESGVKINGNKKLRDGEESGAIVDRGERTESKQVVGGIEQELDRVGITTTAEVSSVERRPPVVKDGCYAAGQAVLSSEKSNAVKNNTQNNFNGNRYKSLVMITQGAYQPVNVVTSDTTTLLQPDENPSPPRGLAGYYHLALETAAELPHRNGNSGPRRPLTVKRPTHQPRVVNIEPEVDSGLSVGSASESDDVQSVKSASKVAAPVTATATPSTDQIALAIVDQSVSSSGANCVSAVEKCSSNESSPRGRAVEATSSSGVVVILEEGLADDDSWVEEVSHDEDEQGATTATEESSEDEANNLGDREEELRGYHRQAIDFTLHTIVEESCEESEAEPSSLAIGSPRKQRPPSASELEKYFFFGLGEGAGNIGGSREIDSLSETSSIYSEGLESLGQDEPGQNTEKNSPDYLSSSSRLEKYFLSDFLGFDRDRRDSDGSVGSDSEGRPSPEQRRKRLVRARGTGRSHSSSLDNLLALTQGSANLSSQNSLQDLSLNPDSQETQSEGSSTETDGADDQMPAFGTDGQFDTVKRKKKKPRNLGTQSPRIPDDRNKTPEPAMAEADGDLLEAVNSEDDRAKTPQPDTPFSTSSQSTENNRTKQTLQASDSAHPTGRNKQQQSDSGRGNGGQGNEVNLARSKQHSRDSGFIGSCDDLLQHQRVSSSSDGQNSNGGQDLGKKDSHHERRSSSDTKYKEGGSSSKVEQPVSQVTLAPPNASLSRKDSFNNWSSDEETNLMMSKMRQFFKTMVANSNNGLNSTNNSSAASPAPSPRLPGSSPRSRLANQNRTKPPQLVYFENELTRLMKTVPGIRDEQVKEIVEYLSSEDTWSDSYDSSDYTSSDLEGAGGRRSALQEQISQSCQQIISKFDTTGSTTEATLAGKEAIPSTQPAQPLSCRDTAFVYQKLVQSFTKMTGDGVSSDASSTPHSSPPLIAKVMHHIGSRLVALMHEVSEGGPAVQPSSWRRYPHHRTPSSASTTEDDDSTSDSANTPAQHQLPRSKSHDPLLLLNGHPAAGYQEGEEREASDNERFSWRGSFESALMPADSRTKLSLLACSGDVSASASALAMAAKRRSAGDLLFNPKSLSREQLDRVRSCGSIGGGSGSIEDKIWSNRRRSSVPDANTRGESGASAGDDDTEDELEYSGDSRATTLPRGLQAAATATNSLPRLPAVSPTSGPVTMHKAHSVHHFLQQHNNVKSARYRPPGFARNNLTGGGAGGPKRAVSAPGLQIPAGSNPVSKRETARSRRQAVSLTPDDGSSLSEACSTPIIGGVRGGSLSNDDEMDRSLHTSLLVNRASSSSLGARSDSMASVYSGAGEGRWCGSVAVRGEVEFALEYDYKQKTFEVRVTQCRDLAPVDVKRNRSDPYVKVYLLPDKSKGGKRKTKVKKHTLNPVFDETLKFHMSLNGLETRTLWLTVWHSDMFGRNDFLGEVRMALENKIFDDLTPRWYPLQERSEPFDDPITCKGEVIVGLKFVPPDPTQQNERLSDRSGTGEKLGSKTRKSWSKGALHVLVKEARNLQTRAKHGGTCDPFCKSYLLPDKGRSGKQKTGVVRKCTGGSPVWGHTFVYKDVSLQELAERGLELTVWDHDRIASNEFLGGVRFNLGTGKHYGKSVEWMDATGRELSLWQNMLERPNFWVEGAVTLRPNLHNHPRNNTT